MRDIAEAAKTLMYADRETLEVITQRDPSMIRDVAAALIHSISPEPHCGDDDHGCNQTPCICVPISEWQGRGL